MKFICFFKCSPIDYALSFYLLEHRFIVETNQRKSVRVEQEEIRSFTRKKSPRSRVVSL